MTIQISKSVLPIIRKITITLANNKVIALLLPFIFLKVNNNFLIEKDDNHCQCQETANYWLNNQIAG